MVKKDEVEAKEREHQQLEAKLNQLEEERKTQQVKLDGVKGEGEKLDGQLKILRARTVQLQSVIEDQKSKQKQEHDEQAILQKECEEAEAMLAGERGALAASQRAQGKLLEARGTLIAVRETLSALTSDEARDAARNAAGGDLPVDIVPRSVEASGNPLLDPVELWTKSGATGEVPDALRLVCTSQGVMMALARSLAVRADEIREGLRQWGFAQNATMRTKELISGLEADRSRDRDQSAELDTELGQLVKDFQADATGVSEERETVGLLRSRHELLVKGLAAAREAARCLQEQVKEHTRLTDTIGQVHKQLKSEDEEQLQQVEAEKLALNKHPEEHERRTSAARQLAKRADDQAKKTMGELKQSQQHLDSFKQANIAVKEAQRIIGEQMKAEQQCYDNLTADHNLLHLELNALARHYIDELPILPGLTEKPLFQTQEVKREVTAVPQAISHAVGVAAAASDDSLRPAVGGAQAFSNLGSDLRNSFTFGDDSASAVQGSSAVSIVEDAAMAMGKRIVLRV